jgi:hypothetical protein
MKYIVMLFLCALFLPGYSFADVRINEVAWMGTAASQYSEWIELYNDSAEAVSLVGWKLYKTADTLLYTLSKSISAHGYLLVERTTTSAPDAVPGTNDESGPFGGGGLRNSGEYLTLKDQHDNPINELPFASGWPAGDAKTKDTMQWDGTKWITAKATPDAKNATVSDVSAPTSTTVPTTTTSTSENTATTPAVIAPPVTIMLSHVPTPVIESDPEPIASVVEVAQSQTTTIAELAIVPIPVPTISAQLVQPVVATIPIVHNTVAKKSTYSSVPVSKGADSLMDSGTVSDAANPASAGASAGIDKNNHTKVIIFGAVIFIGTALFLLLERFKARQE